MNYGGFWIRFLAYLVDSVIVFILVVVLAAAVAFLGEAGAALIPAICLGVPVLYWALMQASAHQATIGKALLGLKVTDATGARLAVTRSLAREVCKYISAIPLLIGFIIAGVTKRKQALHDFFANTTVVRDGRAHVLIALVIGLFGWIAPAALVTVVGVGLFSGMTDLMGGDMLAAVQEAQKQASAPAPKPPVPAPQKPAAAKQAPAPAPAAPVVVKTAVPVAVPSEPAKASVEAKPAPVLASTTVVAQAPEAPKPTAAPKEPAKPAAASKEPEKPKPVARKPKPAAPQEPAMAKEPAKAAPVQMAAAAPAGPGPRFNDLITAVLYRDLKTVEALLAFGKWVDKPDSQGTTPLQLAASLGEASIAAALLKAGANPNLPGPGGETALAIARERNDAAMLGLLKQYGGR